MADATSKTQVIGAPDGREVKTLTFSSTVRTAIQAKVDDPDAAEVRYVNVDMPAGCHALYNAPRQCGDWYAELTRGKEIRCATGADQLSALKHVALKMESAA